MLKRLPPEIGTDVDGMRINALAFADDLVLVAATEIGLQTLIDHATDFLSKCGLEANTAKCATLSIRNVPKEKRIAIDHRCSFNIGGAKIPTLKYTSQWKYLGIQFSPDGRTQCDIYGKLEEKLVKLAKAPLKPQQRMWALRVIVIPGIFYQLSLGNCTFGLLRKLDRRLRKAAREWLHLPADTPNSYFHSKIEDGGLGIPSIRWKAPAERLGRLLSLKTSGYIIGRASEHYLDDEIAKTKERLKTSGKILKSNDDIGEYWSKQLYKKYDGMALKPSSKVKQQHNWIGDGTKFLSGRDYVNSVKLRINALPSRARCSRGRAQEKQCRGGCGVVETTNHILQQCHRTHTARIKRHDAITTYVERRLKQIGFTVEIEPRFHLESGLKKPDIAATKNNITYIIDAQVVSDKIDPDLAHRTKTEKYSSEELRREVTRSFNSTETKTLTVTLNWRGVWSPKSVDGLVADGIIRRSDLKVISSRVLIGGIAGFNVFNKSTMVKRRVGVG